MSSLWSFSESGLISICLTETGMPFVSLDLVPIFPRRTGALIQMIEVFD
jgi:hypothetical protein